MHFVLIGNYPPDKQESMERFAQMMMSGLVQANHTAEIWRPVAIFGKKLNTLSGIGKWLGYIDKWFFFPIILKVRLLKRVKENTRFHVCDHSNAFYLNQLPADKAAITCHDVLAIRGALGYKDAYCPSSATGVVLQKWILRNLVKAKFLACVSELTLKQLSNLSNNQTENRNWVVIHNAFNADFGQIAVQEAKSLTLQSGITIDRPFILHIGSNLERKNRVLLVDMLAELKDVWNGVVCFAGKEPSEQIRNRAIELGLAERVISVVKPSHETLVALYNTCDAFIFPSFSEGFGWPVIEAQACGAPVIASKIAPMPEVSGGAALHANPYDPKDFAAKFLKLKSSSVLRKELVNKGFENIKRFEPQKMIDRYLLLHGVDKGE